MKGMVHSMPHALRWTPVCWHDHNSGQPGTVKRLCNVYIALSWQLIPHPQERYGFLASSLPQPELCPA
jgi:hypothetical protein